MPVDLRRLLGLRPRSEFVSAYIKAERKSTKWWRQVSPTSAQQRDATIRQILIGQVAYIASVLLIYAAQSVQPSPDRTLLNEWFAVATANFVLRMGLFALYVTRAPEVIAAHPWWRLVPMINIAIVGVHWAWTATMFLDPSWTFGTFTTIVVFLLMSIVSLTYAFASPVPAILYLSFLWIPVAVVMWPMAQQSYPKFGILCLGVLSVLLMSLYLMQGQARSYLRKVEEVDVLVNRLQSSNAELQRLHSEADEQLQERVRFFGSASHDFGQRLHALKLLVYAAQGEAQRRLNGSLASLSYAVADLEAYVRDLLDFAKSESRIATPDFRVLHLQDVFQNLAVQFEPIAEDRHVDLRFRATAAEVVTDEAILRRVLENIVGNALKFSKRSVLVGARRTAGSWRIEVWDQGPGIAPEAKDKIFSAFYQGSTYADPKHVGVGLGLAIVKRLADGMQYKIEVNSRIGRGSVFKVTLP